MTIARVYRALRRMPLRFKRRRLVRQLRAEFEAIGVHLPASDFRAYLRMARATRRVSRVIAKTGMTAEEASAGLAVFAKLG